MTYDAMGLGIGNTHYTLSNLARYTKNSPTA